MFTTALDAYLYLTPGTLAMDRVFPLRYAPFTVLFTFLVALMSGGP